MINSRPAKNAFTLVELLVVIVIIAILAALIFPSLSRAKNQAHRTTCLNNVRQVNLGLRMYTQDFNDIAPKTPATSNVPSLENLIAFVGYKQKMKSNVGLTGASSPRDQLFACPADRFYFGSAYVGQGFHEQRFTDFSSYAFNAGTTDPLVTNTPGLAGRKVNSIKDPSRTVLIAELSAIFPWSWHDPKRPLGIENSAFNDAKNMVSFVDGGVRYIKIFYNTNYVFVGTNGYQFPSAYYDPPAGYDYKWSPD